ncbi:hypothetical protein A2313_01555 [Candidatus Roizmanbacteria bacterium RIFOXYB2_FULL_41_10]|uniref:Uncharacterized protein n=1 Tax=Candidatus Roizmanbacteria bacterium RIFOXYA1_FULL_41_12 TaxID=1802082 RepID=A0A1F7KGK0_9BACT|nr:MAG: hypothetical protein A2262_02555 [Candidatus Roizmanbacteria bacterium RIFOXYA2_FULL_41_8]OGK66997.1 MAG: hypothetical protein A2209_02990 [Candidatus Roizmanbacteria bacterium RIFOXYA1_FULL_41_12]OGK71054.1 MAG: hypothetical protein A2313_01555 [Candidatus Roizmanbacteria bacterium RIFOXYB2_FULL_41_10]OGK71710.1 MAG: hypothetical protein A2403_04600 [Candidatus Roizmanbacteria bacterium RIFOXYC1_FULL_41_16]OGK72941.1 MAG: hypothetical protein A2459_00275 [Candidatus Roizmanbacteria bac
MPTTIVNPTPTNNSNSNNGMGFFLGAIVLLVFGLLFYMYGLPLIRQGFSGFGTGDVQINLPEKVDVNVQQTK